MIHCNFIATYSNELMQATTDLEFSTGSFECINLDQYSRLYRNKGIEGDNVLVERSTLYQVYLLNGYNLAH